MISSKMVEKLNYQMNREIYSGYLYLGMSAYASSAGLQGIAGWFTVQMQEEFSHAQKFYKYLEQQGGKIELNAIERPPQEYKSVQELFDETLAHERVVTSLINDLMALAQKENDKATEIFLQWFVSEQVEEEASVGEVIQKMKLVGKDGNGILMIDNLLGQRVFNPPQSAE